MTKKQKALAFHSSSELYGADRIFAQTINFLAEAGLSIEAYLPREGPLISYIEQNKNIRVQTIEKFPIAVRSAFGFRSLIKFFQNCIKTYSFLRSRRNDADYLYINTMSLFALTFLGRLAGYKKIILHSHEIISHHGFLPRLMSMITLAYSSKIICVSYAVKRDLENSMNGLFKQKIAVVHNGVPYPRYSKTSDGIESRTTDRIRFLLVGRIMPEKGQWFVLEALSLLRENSLKDLTFTFIGGGAPGREHLVDELKSSIKEKGLSEIIEIAPFKSNLSEVYPQFDVCVIPSMMPDPFPTTVLEAMSYSRPVITTNHGGAAEIVQDGFSGKLITPGDSAKLAHAIETYLLNPELINIHGQNGYNFFSKNLTLQHFKERFLNAFS